MKRKLLIGFLIAGAITMIVMSTHYLRNRVSGILILPGNEMAEINWYRNIFKCHILFGLLAISIGPFQLIKSLRKKYRKYHIRAGYVYACSVGLSSISGLVIAQYAMGGWMASLGFSFLAVFWFTSLLLGVWNIRNGNSRKHRKWMYINYGLTFAAIPQRTMLLLPLLINQVSFIPVYRLSAWLPWMLNASIAYYLYIRHINDSKSSIT